MHAGSIAYFITGVLDMGGQEKEGPEPPQLCGTSVPHAHLTVSFCIFIVSEVTQGEAEGVLKGAAALTP